MNPATEPTTAEPKPETKCPNCDGEGITYQKDIMDSPGWQVCAVCGGRPLPSSPAPSLEDEARNAEREIERECNRTISATTEFPFGEKQVTVELLPILLAFAQRITSTKDAEIARLQAKADEFFSLYTTADATLGRANIEYAQKLEEARQEVERLTKERDEAIIKYTGQADAAERAHKVALGKVEQLRAQLVAMTARAVEKDRWWARQCSDLRADLTTLAARLKAVETERDNAIRAAIDAAKSQQEKV